MRGPLGFLAGWAASGLLAMLNSPDLLQRQEYGEVESLFQEVIVNGERFYL